MRRLVKESLSNKEIPDIRIGDILHVTLPTSVPTSGKWDVEIKDIYYSGLMDEVMFDLLIDNRKYKDDHYGTYTDIRRSIEQLKKEILPYIN